MTGQPAHYPLPDTLQTIICHLSHPRDPVRNEPQIEFSAAETYNEVYIRIPLDHYAITIL
jgi:hypothetical protein